MAMMTRLRHHAVCTSKHHPHHLAAARRRPVALQSVASASTDTQAASTASASQDEVVPPGCSRYSICVKKPLGLVLEQNKETLVITVAEINPEGNAAKTGLVAVGDQLIATSGVTYTTAEDYGGVTVKKGQQIVRMNVIGQQFKAVSAAIGSHPGHMDVKLEFQRCSSTSS